MRIIIKYDPYNRLGNRMFQYAFGVLLAKKYNCELYCTEGLPNFGIPAKLPREEPGLPKLPEGMCRISKNAFYSRDMGEQYFDFEVAKDTDGDIVIDSWVQKSEYYVDHQDLLRETFGIKDLESINEDSLVLHIRGTDYNALGWFLGYEFYKKLIEDSGFTKIKIVTDDPLNETVNKLVEDGCELVTSGPLSEFNINADRRAIDDFKTLLYSSNIALSQSSFSWWAAFLGYHKKIIFPYTTTNDKAMWPKTPLPDDPDLFFDFNGTSVKYIS